MDNDKQDNIFKKESEDLLPLDFPDDDDIEEEQIEEKTVKISFEKKDEDNENEIEEKEDSDNDIALEDTIAVKSEYKKEEVTEDKIEERPPSAKKIKGFSSPIQGSFLPGQILQEGRVRADLSIDQVAQTTKINKQFISSLEIGDQEKLPSDVYVNAYIKQLCKLYKIDPDQVLDSLKSNLSPNANQKVSGEILHDIEKGKQVNFQEEVRVRKMVKTVVAVVAVIVVTVLVIIKITVPSKQSVEGVDEVTPPAAPVIVDENNIEGPPAPLPAPASSITSADLEIFLIDQPFTMTELKDHR